MDLITRLYNKKVVDVNSGCWLWAGAKYNGYGIIEVEGKKRLVHRISYEIHKNSITNKLVIDHLCRQRSCFNPEHLDMITQAENVKRGEANLWNKPKTYCFRGHPYDDQNTYSYPDKNQRACKACHREYHRLYRSRNKLMTAN